MNIVICDQDVIARFDEIGAHFFTAILGLEYSKCLVTDESRLSDFAFGGWCGEDWSVDEQLDELYKNWDAWVIEKIAGRYGLRITSTALTMVRLFEQIRLAQTFQTH